MFTQRSTIAEFRAISMGEFWGDIVFVNWDGHVNVDELETHYTHHELTVDDATTEWDIAGRSYLSSVAFAFISISCPDSIKALIVSKLQKDCSVVVDAPLSDSLAMSNALRFVSGLGFVLFRDPAQRADAVGAARLLEARAALEVEVDSGTLQSPRLGPWVLVGREDFTLNIQHDCDLLYGDVSGWSAEALPSRCFLGCRRLEAVSLPPGLLRIESSAFEYCDGLTNVGLENCPKLEAIGKKAVRCTRNLRGVTFPATVGVIGEHAFTRSGIVCVDLSQNRDVLLWAKAFSLCTSLAEVSLPDSARVTDHAFQCCTSLAVVRGKSKVSRLSFAACRVRSINGRIFPHIEDFLVKHGLLLPANKRSEDYVPLDEAAAPDALPEAPLAVECVESLSEGKEQLVVASEPGRPLQVDIRRATGSLQYFRQLHWMISSLDLRKANMREIPDQQPSDCVPLAWENL
jgi:hypothetical protein